LDAKVQKELRTWDKVRCKLCGEEISMVSASMLKDNSGFIHRGGRCPSSYLSRQRHEEEYLGKFE